MDDPVGFDTEGAVETEGEDELAEAVGVVGVLATAVGWTGITRGFTGETAPTPPVEAGGKIGLVPVDVGLLAA